MIRFTPPHDDARTPRRRIMLAIVKEGRDMVAQDGRRCYAGPGEMFLVDPSRSFMTEPDHIVFQSIQVPRSALCGVLRASATRETRLFPLSAKSWSRDKEER
jgi:hypothetical protein